MRYNLTEARKEKAYTQSEIAQKLEISLRQYQRLESGESNGKLPLWEKIKVIVNEPIDKIMINK